MMRESIKHINVLMILLSYWTKVAWEFSHPGFERETVSLDLCACENSHIHTETINTDQVSLLHEIRLVNRAQVISHIPDNIQTLGYNTSAWRPFFLQSALRAMLELIPLSLKRSMIAEVEWTRMSGSASWKSCKLIEDWKYSKNLHQRTVRSWGKKNVSRIC